MNVDSGIALALGVVGTILGMLALLLSLYNFVHWKAREVGEGRATQLERQPHNQAGEIARGYPNHVPAPYDNVDPEYDEDGFRDEQYGEI